LAAVAVTLRVYVPGVVFVVVFPPVLTGVLLLPPPQPERLNAPTERRTTRSGAILRRRGAMKKKRQAMETTEPEYQLSRKIPGRWRAAVVVWEAVMVRVAVPEEPAERFTDEEERARFALITGSELIDRVTGPLKLFAEVIVKVIPLAVVPELTAVEVVHGVSAKSAVEEETKSDTSVPLEVA